MQRGLTLIELLVALSLAGILLSLAAPSFRDLLAAQRASAASNAIIGAVRLARAAAISHRRTVVLCPADGDRCGGHADWPAGAWIFGDGNGNGERDDGEPLYGALPAFERGASLRWRSFRNRSHLRFLPTGLTAWQNGHFHYCPASADERFARMIILNAAGRTRVAPDRDGDGVVEDARGEPLECRGAAR
jgi:type IV fimbrial biogenesis protein FimT